MLLKHDCSENGLITPLELSFTSLNNLVHDNSKSKENYEMR